MRTIARTLALLLTLGTSIATFASEPPSWLVDTMYKSGKINAVVAVVTVIIAGLATWLFLMDRRLKRMENEVRNGRG